MSALLVATTGDDCSNAGGVSGGGAAPFGRPIGGGNRVFEAF